MDKFFLQCKSKAIATLFSYAVRLEQGGQQEMVDAIFRAARASELILQWPQIRRHATALLDKSSPSSLNRVIILMSPYISWDHWLGTQNAVARWAMAASLAPYSEEVSQSVVDALLWVSGDETLRLHIPVDMWARLKRRTSLPPLYRGQSNGSQGNIVNHVRGLGDVEILKSYLLLVWSEWHDLWPDGLREMEISIRNDFGGIGMWCHRDDLVKHLDHVQLELDRGLEHFERHNPWVDEDKIKKRKGRYGHLKNVLLEVDKTAMETLTRTPPELTLFDLCANLVFRIPHRLHVFFVSPVSVILCFGRCHFKVRVSVLQPFAPCFSKLVDQYRSPPLYNQLRFTQDDCCVIPRTVLTGR